MPEGGETFKRVASECESKSKAALAAAKHAAQVELERIFEEEAKEYGSDQRFSLARPATASGS
jgi:hypothetical protein